MHYFLFSIVLNFLSIFSSVEDHSALEIIRNQEQEEPACVVQSESHEVGFGVNQDSAVSHDMYLLMTYEDMAVGTGMTQFG